MKKLFFMFFLIGCSIDYTDYKSQVKIIITDVKYNATTKETTVIFDTQNDNGKKLYMNISITVFDADKNQIGFLEQTRELFNGYGDNLGAKISTQTAGVTAIINIIRVNEFYPN